MTRNCWRWIGFGLAGLTQFLGDFRQAGQQIDDEELRFLENQTLAWTEQLKALRKDLDNATPPSTG